MKTMKYICISALSALIFAVTFTSCNDYLTLYPEDDIVDDEYWQTGDQVQSVVASAYRYMIDNNVVRKMIYWGELRSDNEDYSTGGTEEEYLHDANLLSSNSIVKWDGFYKVINICNEVIAKAPGVCNVDANFTEATMHKYLSEAYTLRALCYFYLVRSFGDVPYVTTPSESEQTNYMVSQSSGDSIIGCLISDMQTYALPYSASDWPTEAYTHGRITTNAVRALLADLYLWKASDISNKDADTDYQKCISYCDAILSDDNSTLVFTDYDKMYNDVFYEGNATENIFELNFVTGGLANTATSSLYGNPKKSANAHFLPTQKLYSLFGTNDTRRYQYLELSYSSTGSDVTASSYKIFKYEGQSPASDFGTSDYTYRGSTSYANWIVYRLADVYLMKAEAYAELAKNTSNNDYANEAVTLCNVTYKRATQELDTLQTADPSKVEEVVLNERRREFCFEGKRWYDLLRKVRREGTTENALTVLLSARTGETSVIQARLSSIGAWYLPISKTEMNVNPNLHQNSYYSLKEQ
jgi:hypothetical protein